MPHVHASGFPSPHSNFCSWRSPELQRVKIWRSCPVRRALPQPSRGTGADFRRRGFKPRLRDLASAGDRPPRYGECRISFRRARTCPARFQTAPTGFGFPSTIAGDRPPRYGECRGSFRRARAWAQTKKETYYGKKTDRSLSTPR